ncbi:MAG: MarR family winged helix-turn-helix transcriptional regulator [Oscillospiraceae bacterium]|nr:MarR family winged helix-turn-helix transcriptional regulator [Oscillospiraceae bacterium]
MDYKRITNKQERLRRLMNIHFSSFFDDMPLTSNQAMALEFIISKSEHGDVFPKDLEAHLSIRGSSVASLVNHLDQSGYLVREPVAFDGRYKRLVPTEKAYAVRDKINDRINRYTESLFVGISDEDLTVFESVIEKIEGNIVNNNK